MADDLYGEDESDGSGPTESSIDFILEPDASESDDEEFEVPFHTPGPLGTEMERRTSWDDVEDTSEAQTQDHNHRGGGDVEPASTDTDTNLWGDNQIEAEPAKEWECPTHGARCSRGLCTEYGKYKAGKNRAEREKERANNAGKHGKKAKQQSGRDGTSGIVDLLDMRILKALDRFRLRWSLANRQLERPQSRHRSQQHRGPAEAGSVHEQRRRQRSR